MFLLKQAYAQRRQGSEHGPWDTERHRSTGPSSHGRHRTWHYSLRRGFGDRVCLGPIWWDEPIHVHLSCIYMYMHVEIHTRVLRNIIHIYIYISLYSTDLYSETNVFGMVGVEAASRMLSEPWWHRSLGPLCRSRSLDFRHAEAWSNRPKNGLAYNMFIMTSTKMEKWFITIYCK